VQFARLKNYSSAQGGWFWKQQLNGAGEWPKTSIAPKLLDQFERFDGDALWAQFPIINIPAVSERLQIVSSDEQRMIQLQDNRFAFNWRKQGDSGYPSFDSLYPEFIKYFSAFSQFAKDLEGADLEINQWEITYVNNIEKGQLWDSVSDWNSIIPAVSIPKAFNSNVESVHSEWRHVIGDKRGRLYISAAHARVGVASAESLLLQLVARGPIDKERGFTLEDGFKLGHEVIVKTFADITSERAHKLWQRKS